MTVADSTPPPAVSDTQAARAVELRKTYGTGAATVHALAGINVAFERGRFTAVMGPSGSGKSTLMHCMAGLDRPTSGRSYVGDLDIGTLDDAGLTQLRRDRIGFVFQSFNLVPTLTAGENITLPVDLAGRKVDRDWFDYLVAPAGYRRPARRTGRRRCRAASSSAVACARALINRPDLIFADEPTGNLDSNASAEMLVVLAPLGGRVRPVDRHGDPRPARRRVRGPGPSSWPTATSSTSWSEPTADSVLERMRTLGA